MRTHPKIIKNCIASLLFLSLSGSALAAPAITVIGEDVVFPNTIADMPEKLSDFQELEIQSFTTSDGVRLSYWEAGSGKPLLIIPGWSATGAELINVMYALKNSCHVYVLDPRNQGLSDKVDYGMRIARYAQDLKEWTDYLQLSKANYCGWSMGASVLYSYIDLYGTSSIDKLILVDEPPSILTRPGWSEEDCALAGARFDTAEQVLTGLSQQDGTDFLTQRFNMMDSPYFENSETFARRVIKNDMNYMGLIMYDHASNDWRDVISRKIDVPTAIFTGEYSTQLTSQYWMHSVIPHSQLFVYSPEEQGDHFLMMKNPVKFAEDVKDFLNN